MFYNNVYIKKYAFLCLFLASDFASSTSVSTWRSCRKNSLNTQYIKLKVMRVLTFAENICSSNLYNVCLINDV